MRCPSPFLRICSSAYRDRHNGEFSYIQHMKHGHGQPPVLQQASRLSTTVPYTEYFLYLYKLRSPSVGGLCYGNSLNIILSLEVDLTKETFPPTPGS